MSNDNEMSRRAHWPQIGDLAHLLHSQTIGGDPSGGVKTGRVEQTSDAVVLTADYFETPFGSAPRQCTFTYRILLPFAIDFTVAEASGHVMHAYNIPCPISAYESRVFQVIKLSSVEELSSNAEIQRAAIAGFDAINQEDIQVLKELAVPDMPLDQHHEIHLPVDNVCGAYRGRLLDMGLGQR
jgi:Vanillate O-demethylase oxygenase C-terminal domain